MDILGIQSEIDILRNECHTRSRTDNRRYKSGAEVYSMSDFTNFFDKDVPQQQINDGRVGAPEY